MFSKGEGHVLERGRVCSRKGKDVFSKGVGQGGEGFVAVRFCDIG